MSEAKRKTSVEPVLDAAAVADYLQNHPDFLQRHPDVLAALRLSHDSGTAASLIERQVGLLRDSNRQLQSRLNELIEMARGNEQRVLQLNSLAKALIGAGDTAELVSALADCVKREMDVDAVFIGIRGMDAAGDARGCIHALTRDDPCSKAVTHVFRRGKPVCDALSADQVQALFGDNAPALTSAAMVPLGVRDVHGALVLASTEPEHFVPDMGTLFVGLVGELVTTGLRRHLGSHVLP